MQVSTQQPSISNKWIIYFVTNAKRTVIHAGMTRDLIKSIHIINNLPLLLSESNDKINRLVYFEEYDSLSTCNQRFNSIKNYTKAQKEKLIRSINPDWIDLTIGIDFEKVVFGSVKNHLKIKNLSN